MDKVIIIAEAGVNHNGSLELAKELIDVATRAGVDYIKFQSFKSSKVVTALAKKALYQQKNIADGDDSQLDMAKKLELSYSDHRAIVDYCGMKGIGFLSTAYDDESMDMLQAFGVDFIKIPSGEITNLPYLRKAASYNKPIIISTGMAFLGEVESAIRVLVENGVRRDSICVLHCNTEYPTPIGDVNLMAMQTIGHALKVKVGYSDHTLGIEVPIAAVALGACVIEKHFTLDRNMTGPDHKASLEPNELLNMVLAIRNIEQAICGDGLKTPSKSELANIPIVRRSIHLSRTVLKDSILKQDDLIMKRPGYGISPMEIDRVIGKRTLRDLSEDHCLVWTDIV